MKLAFLERIIFQATVSYFYSVSGVFSALFRFSTKGSDLDSFMIPVYIPVWFPTTIRRHGTRGNKILVPGGLHSITGTLGFRQLNFIPAAGEEASVLWR